MPHAPSRLGADVEDSGEGIIEMVVSSIYDLAVIIVVYKEGSCTCKKTLCLALIFLYFSSLLLRAISHSVHLFRRACVRLEVIYLYILSAVRHTPTLRTYPLYLSPTNRHPSDPSLLTSVFALKFRNSLRSGPADAGALSDSDFLLPLIAQSSSPRFTLSPASGTLFPRFIPRLYLQSSNLNTAHRTPPLASISVKHIPLLTFLE